MALLQLPPPTNEQAPPAVLPHPLPTIEQVPDPAAITEPAAVYPTKIPCAFTQTAQFVVILGVTNLLAINEHATEFVKPHPNTPEKFA